MGRLLHYTKPHWKSRRYRKAKEHENMLVFIRKYYINIRSFFKEEELTNLHFSTEKGQH